MRPALIRDPFASRRRRRSAVTLIELLWVIGIIGILLGLLLGPISRAYKKAKDLSGETP